MQRQHATAACTGASVHREPRGCLFCSIDDIRHTCVREHRHSHIFEHAKHACLCTCTTCTASGWRGSVERGYILWAARWRAPGNPPAGATALIAFIALVAIVPEAHPRRRAAARTQRRPQQAAYSSRHAAGSTQQAAGSTAVSSQMTSFQSTRYTERLGACWEHQKPQHVHAGRLAPDVGRPCCARESSCHIHPAVRCPDVHVPKCYLQATSETVNASFR